MPTVPGAFQGPRLLPQGQQDVRANPAAFGALQAEAMGRVSQQVAQAGDQLGRVAMVIQDAQNATALTNAQVDWAKGLAEIRGSLEMEADPKAIQERWTQGTEA